MAATPPGGGEGGPGGPASSGGPAPPPPLPPGPQGPQAHQVPLEHRSSRSPTSGSHFVGSNGCSNASCGSGTAHPRSRKPAPPSRVKIPPPIFKGLPGKRPKAHLMRANDWMDIYNILPVDKPTNFKHTLDHLAREWYDSLTFLQQRFSRYFSMQGKSIKHLHDKWRNFFFKRPVSGM